MVDSLQLFASEVSKVAQDVGINGKLGILKHKLVMLMDYGRRLRLM